MNNNKTICILIPVHNGIDYTKKALIQIHNSLKKLNNSRYTFYIIIIDDGSTDGTSEWIKKNYKDIHIIKGDGNKWWSGSVNIGIKYAINTFNTNYFLLFNNDLIIANDYFKKLIEVINQYNENKTIIISKVYYLNNPDKVFSMGALFNRYTGYSRVLNYKYSSKYNFNMPLEVDWAGGMGVLLPINVINNVGYFDEINFPQYKGDFDFFLRCKNYEYKIIAHPMLKIWNDTTQTGLKVKDFYSFIMSFFDQKSQLNIYENCKFYFKHAFPIIGLYGMFIIYLKHVWKYFNILINKKNIF